MLAAGAAADMGRRLGVLQRSMPRRRAARVHCVAPSSRSLSSRASPIGTFSPLPNFQKVTQARLYSSGGKDIAHQNRQTLERMRQMIEEVGPVNSSAQKISMLKDFPDLRDFLIK